jgi:hypothetical protein
MKENSYYGKFYHDPSSPVNPLRPFASSNPLGTQGLERIGIILARSISLSPSTEISETEGGAR